MTGNISESHRRRTAVQSGALDLKIKLTCGCTIVSQLEPYRNMKLACESRLGHGYQLRWVSITYPNGFVSHNKGVQA